LKKTWKFTIRKTTLANGRVSYRPWGKWTKSFRGIPWSSSGWVQERIFSACKSRDGALLVIDAWKERIEENEGLKVVNEEDELIKDSEARLPLT